MTTPITPIPPSSFLLHAVGGVARGSYVVVGEPEGDGSVADAFYARGWRGITVVSSSGTEEAAAARRPQDVVVVRPPGSAGWGRLADALAKSPGEVQVLVTAAGHESVLAELDQAHVRPWVVAVLAMQGHDDVPPAPDQGGVLAGAGYRRVLFDGATDYYVAPAHLELREAFRVTVDASGGLQADAGSPEIRAELERTRALVTHLERWAEAAENWARTAEQRYDESRLDLDEAAEELAAAQDLAAATERENDAIRHSTSWRVTSPLRGVSRLGRAVTRGAASGVKGAVRPAFDAGLTFVRGNEKVKMSLRRVLTRVPTVEGRLQRFADARPVTGADQ